MAPKTSESPPMTHELPPKTAELGPKSAESSPKTSESPPMTPELPPKSAELSPKTAEPPPMTPELPPKTAELTPNTPETPMAEAPNDPKINPEKVPNKSESAEEVKKPLVVMFPWLVAEPHNLLKYTPFYTDRGFDVLAVTVKPWQLLLPVKGVQLVAAELLEFLLHHAEYSPLILHGFSVGGYVWGECCVRAVDSGERYVSVMRRFVGQVWESCADVQNVPDGVSSTLFPNSPRIREEFRKYIKYHMRNLSKISTRHYERASVEFRVNQVKAPALFFVSKNDEICSEKTVLRLRESWAEQGIKTYYKCWDVSSHATHYRQHPEEYAIELNCFLDALGLKKPGADKNGDLTITSKTDN